MLVYLSLLGGGVFGALQFVGLQLTTALNVSVMNSLGAGVHRGRERRDVPRPADRRPVRRHRDLAASACSRSSRKLDPARAFRISAFNIGDIIILLNMVLWAVYSASLRWRPTIHPLSFMFMFALISGVAMLPAVRLGVFDRLRAAADRC